ncbi:WD repeat-containing protein 46 isoform X2 [Dunckerocampus dactyliophorus]|uniref:WD repeat-containing protein 46 isoform X2 n=1 Tax=Dunckerocampus dactyliophorus TaxID=161453 RepID=UPI0024072909|nr:WD repeat-containing protein 46 isoform X2 [Dunckerocampus dactyliophorus]
MAAASEDTAADLHVGRKKKTPVRYWHQQKYGNQSGEKTGDKQHQNLRTMSAAKRKNQDDQGHGKRDPFPGPAPIPKARMKKFARKEKSKEQISKKYFKLRAAIAQSDETSKLAQKQAARFDLLLPEEAGFLEGDKDEDTCTISQHDIAEAVDITSGAKYFNLNLSQFGPYRLDYSKTGRHLLLGGRRGHVACVDWQSKQLMCEINVMESINDVRWLHTETMFAVAQKKWLYIYDSNGIELHCIRKFNDILRMQFLPYHFLLATASATSFLQYLDVSVGKEVATICTKMGRLDVMCQNPYNAIIHLGHPNGTVTLWSPNQKEAVVKMLCHQGGVRSVTVDKTGTYMVTSGMDKKLKVFDIRKFQPVKSYFLPEGASCLSLSQRGLLSAATGDVIQVYRDVWSTDTVTKPYMAHRVRAAAWGLHFCPFEDVLGVGHGQGFTSMLVPGAGEPNFDGLDSNPYRSTKQRQEWEVKALLEKIQPDLISLDPRELGKVDVATFQQRHQDRVEALGFDPLARERFVPKYKKKGRSSTGNVERRKKQVAHGGKRALIVQSMEDKMKMQKERKAKESKASALASQKSALDRFRK